MSLHDGKIKKIWAKIDPHLLLGWFLRKL